MSANPGMSRAERFEDEKRRIIESCFSKRDDDGSVLETYITHLRILEFSQYPTSPPPPQARSPQTEKPRVIIVAVRKSGRVRVHKTKENVNGSFSIGKTWNLDDLAAIESYTGPNTPPDFRQWAGDNGFLVTLGKPYYWEAQTDKEKKFFIASLIKIYGKYTGGRVPSLSNFDQRELDQVLGGAARRGAASQQTPNQPSPSPARPSASPGRPPPPPSPARPLMPSASNQALGSQSNGLDGNAGSDYTRTPSRSPMPPNGNSSPASSFTPSLDSSRNMRSQEAPMRQRLAAGNKSQDSVANSYRSGDESLRPRSRGRPNGVPSPFNKTQEPPPPVLAPAFSPNPSSRTSGDRPSMDRPSMDRPSMDRPSTDRPLVDRSVGDRPAGDRPPERKRPPMDPLRPNGLPPDDALVPAPLSNANLRRSPSRDVLEPSSPIAPPPRSIERMSPRRPSGRLPRPEPPSAIDQIAAEPVEPPALPQPTEPLPPLDTATPPPLSVSANDANNDSPTVPGSASTPADSPITSPVSPEEHRPGLGPMIKAKRSQHKLAGALWKAAAASNAFKPRIGGAGEKLLKAAKEEQNNGPDGITAVVPAPRRPKSIEKMPEPVPEVTVSQAEPAPEEPAKSQMPEPKAGPQQIPEPEVKDEHKKSVMVGNDLKYLTTLGVDPSILDNKTAQFTEWLDFFSWVPGDKMRTLNSDEMKFDIERELNKAQAGGWLARFQEEDERVEGIKTGIDAAVDECDELDNLLTLYAVELSTLQDDIAYIEAQGQGLQVQAANQKLLKKELESLLETCAITANDLRALSMAPLETVNGVEEVETALVTLYKAMIKIDPSMGSPDGSKTGDGSSDQAIDFNGDYAKMRVVQEKRQMYMQESAMFMQRLVDIMAKQFNVANDEVRRALKGALNKKIDPQNHDIGRDMLWKYDPLMLYTRDADLEVWNRLIQIYQDAAHPTYKMEFRDALDSWKRNARKPSGEEALLFSSQEEKKEEGLATAARKLTVKRSQTLARIRSPHGEGQNKAANSSAVDLSRNSPYEIFANVLDDVLPLVEMEQNFVIDFFHATTMEQIDFPDAVAAISPAARRGNDLKRHRLMEPDRDLARRVTRSMEVIFPFLEKDLSNMVDWVLAQSPLQGVGVMANLERKLADIQQSNQDFLNSVLQKVHGNLIVKFKRFVEEQIRAIEDTKVKINKRKGVISFMRVFPPFSMAVENMLLGIDPNLNVRRTVDREYDRILRSMFESLKVIARENPAVGVAAAGAGADPEDKEALNYHILLIENMNHYIEEVETRDDETLEKWKRAASDEINEHMTRYLDAVMRRPLGRLLDTLENIEGQLKSGKAPAAIAAQPSNNKTTFDKVLLHYDAKEVRKGIEALRKRVEKHFDENNSLALKVTKSCETFYNEVEQRINRVVSELYGGEVLVEWPRLEVKSGFR